MNINWKLRLSNKVTLTSLVVSVAALVYQVLGLFGITPGISESDMITVLGMVINVLAVLGVVVDPTTQGITDSAQALDYEKPSK